MNDPLRLSYTFDRYYRVQFGYLVPIEGTLADRPFGWIGRATHSRKSVSNVESIGVRSHPPTLDRGTPRRAGG